MAKAQDIGGNSPLNRQRHAKGVHAQATRDRLVSDTKQAIAVASGIIMLSLVGIAFAPWLSRSWWLRAVPALLLTIVGTAICLVLFWQAIGRALRD